MLVFSALTNAKNILHCLKFGTEMSWLIDPDDKAIFIYRPKQETEVFDEPDQVLPMLAFVKEINLAVKNLFDWLSE